MTLQTWRKKQDPEQLVDVLKLTPDTAEEIVHWCKGMTVQEIDPINPSNTYIGVNVPTFVGKDRASEGDYIVNDIMLGFMVCKPGLFEMMFERIS